MKLWLRWIAGVGMAGACVMAIGCGSDVPDTSTEGEPVAGGAPASEPAAPAPGPANEVASAPAASDKEEAPAAGAEAPAPAPSAAAPAPAKKDGGSATAEMLAAATAPPAGSSPPAAGGASASGTPGFGPASPGAPGAPGAAPGAPGGAPGAMGGMPPAMAEMMRRQSAGPGGAPGMPPGNMMGMKPGMMPPGGRGPNPNDMAKMMAAQMGKMGNRGGAPGSGPANDEAMSIGRGGAAAGAAGGADNGPADNRTPEGAVRAFLNALKAKDRDALNEATALHAYLEATERNREMFKKIFDLELSDAELDDLAKKLEGYRIYTYNPPKSTGKIDIVIQKQGENGAFFRRRMTVRKEKKGWGVMDISGAEEFKSMFNYGRRRR